MPGTGAPADSAALTEREVVKGTWVLKYLRPAVAAEEVAPAADAVQLEASFLDALTPTFASCNDSAGAARPPQGESTPPPSEPVCFPPAQPVPQPGAAAMCPPSGPEPQGPVSPAYSLASSYSLVTDPPVCRWLAPEWGFDTVVSPCSRLFRPPRVWTDA